MAIAAETGPGKGQPTEAEIAAVQEIVAPIIEAAEVVVEIAGSGDTAAIEAAAQEVIDVAHDVSDSLQESLNK